MDAETVLNCGTLFHSGIFHKEHGGCGEVVLLRRQEVWEDNSVYCCIVGFEFGTPISRGGTIPLLAGTTEVYRKTT